MQGIPWPLVRIALRSIRLPCVRPAGGEDASRTDWKTIDGGSVNFHWREVVAHCEYVRESLFASTSPATCGPSPGDPSLETFHARDDCDTIHKSSPARPWPGGAASPFNWPWFLGQMQMT